MVAAFVVVVIALVVWIVGGRVVRAIDQETHDALLKSLASASQVVVIPCEHEQVSTDEGTYLSIRYDAAAHHVVSPNELDELREIVGRTPYLSAGQLAVGMTRCFYPHYAIRFDSESGPDAELLLCFECANLRYWAIDREYRMEGMDRMPGRWKAALRTWLKSLGFSEHL